MRNELLLPATIEIVSTMKGKAAQHLKLIPLSNELLENKCTILLSNLQSIFCNVYLSSKFAQYFPENLSRMDS